MAKITGQSIPPSLIHGYGTTLQTNIYRHRGMATAGLKAATNAAQQPLLSNALLKYVNRTATWLTKQNAPGLPSDFWVARRDEMLNGVFPGQYWYTATKTSDETRLGVPTVHNYTGTIPPAYYDPLRQPSRCVFNDWHDVYPTPIDQGTLDRPRPGWAGEVSNGVWRDLWLAGRYLTFRLPFEIPNSYVRPVLIAVTSSIEVSASFRGVSSWYVRSIVRRAQNHSRTPYKPVDRLVSTWRKTDVLPIEMPPENGNGWSDIDTLYTIRDARASSNFKKISPCDQIDLVLTTPPSRGLYFGRNDYVILRHYETVNVYVGKGING